MKQMHNKRATAVPASYCIDMYSQTSYYYKLYRVHSTSLTPMPHLPLSLSRELCRYTHHRHEPRNTTFKKKRLSIQTPPQATPKSKLLLMPHALSRHGGVYRSVNPVGLTERVDKKRLYHPAPSAAALEKRHRATEKQ